MSIKSHYTLLCEKKDVFGKRENKKIKAEGKLIVDLYFKDSSALHMVTDLKFFKSLIVNPTFLTQVVEIQYEGKKYHAVAKAVNFDSLYKDVFSVEYAEIKPDCLVEYIAPVQIINHEKCVGIKRGGKVVQYAHEVRLKALPKDMVDRVVFNLDGVEYGSKLFVRKAENLNQKIKIVHDIMVAKIVGRVKADAEQKPAA
jgi:large subunit ribosomal protein L25